jgi:ABC-type multidrug transport system fused ATPase/permease subunit
VLEIKKKYLLKMMINMIYLYSDIGKIKDGLGDKFSFTLQYTAQFFAGFAIGFWKSWKMTLVMMSITPVLAVSAGIFSVVST